MEAAIKGNHNAGTAKRSRDGTGVERTGAAKGEQVKIAQIMAAHGGNRLDRFLHLDIDDAHDAFGDIHNTQLEFSCDTVLDGGKSGFRIELHLAAEEIVFAKITQHQIAIG